MALEIRTTCTRAELNEYLRGRGLDVPARFVVRGTRPGAPTEVTATCDKEDAVRVRAWMGRVAEKFGGSLTEE